MAESVFGKPIDNAIQEINDKIGTVPSGETVEGQIDALNSKFITDNFTATLESNSSVSPYSAYTVKNVAKTNYSIISALCTSHNSSNTVLINTDGTTYIQIYGTRAEQISVTVIYAKN